jgi:hypothetical protein
MLMSAGDHTFNFLALAHFSYENGAFTAWYANFQDADPFTLGECGGGGGGDGGRRGGGDWLGQHHDHTAYDQDRNEKIESRPVGTGQIVYHAVDNRAQDRAGRAADVHRPFSEPKRLSPKLSAATIGSRIAPRQLFCR